MSDHQQIPRAYELQLHKAKEFNDITFLMKDVELRKWCLGLEGGLPAAKDAYEFITGYEKAPEPIKEPEPTQDIMDYRN